MARKAISIMKKKKSIVLSVSVALIIAIVAVIVFVALKGFENLLDETLTAVVIGSIAGAIFEFSQRAGKLKVKL